MNALDEARAGCARRRGVKRDWLATAKVPRVAGHRVAVVAHGTSSSPRGVRSDGKRSSPSTRHSAR